MLVVDVGILNEGNIEDEEYDYELNDDLEDQKEQNIVDDKNVDVLEINTDFNLMILFKFIFFIKTK